MGKKTNIFIRIDELVFQKLDILKSETSFQRINELLSSLDENQQKIYAQLLTFFLIIIPYLFVITLWWGNHKAKLDLNIKTQILEQISILNAN